MKKLNQAIDRFCILHPNFGIPNLMLYVVIGNVVLGLLSNFSNGNFLSFFSYTLSGLLHGQVWRLITFVFIPFSGGGPLSVILGIYFTWFIGTALEKEWGDFRFNLYFLLGMIGTVLGCLVTGIPADTYCLSLSLLLAFAMLYPEVQVLLFFVIPVRVKYFGLFAAAMWLFSFLTAGWLYKVSYLLSMLGFVLFFGPQALRSVRAWIRREQWKRKNRR